MLYLSHVTNCVSNNRRRVHRSTVLRPLQIRCNTSTNLGHHSTSMKILGRSNPKGRKVRYLCCHSHASASINVDIYIATGLYINIHIHPRSLAYIAAEHDIITRQSTLPSHVRPTIPTGTLRYVTPKYTHTLVQVELPSQVPPQSTSWG
jgi:hypothetical protein